MPTLGGFGRNETMAYSKYPRFKPWNLDTLAEFQTISQNNKTVPRPSSDKVLHDYLRHLYHSVDKPGSYLGTEKLYDAVLMDGTYRVTSKEIKDWLQSNPEYSKHRKVFQVKQRPRVIVSGIDDQFEADLASFDNADLVQANDGCKYMLVVIDVFSRYLWVRGLENKKVETVLEAFDDIFKNSKRLPRRLRTDRGTEFTSKKTRKFMSERGISQMFTSNEVQANYAERVIQTLKKKIFSFLRMNNSQRYIDVLQDLVTSYNNTWHHGIRELPAKVSKQNEKRLWWQMYWPVERKWNQRQDFVFSVGDFVRISLRKTAFGREYSDKFTGEVFEVVKRFKRQNIPMYILKDYAGDDIIGTFYTNELQKVPQPRDFKIEAVLKNRLRKELGVGEIQVSYEDYPKKFNRWIRGDIFYKGKQIQTSRTPSKAFKMRRRRHFAVDKVLARRGQEVKVSYKNLPDKFNRWVNNSTLIKPSS